MDNRRYNIQPHVYVFCLYDAIPQPQIICSSIRCLPRKVSLGNQHALLLEYYYPTTKYPEGKATLRIAIDPANYQLHRHKAR